MTRILFLNPGGYDKNDAPAGAYIGPNGMAAGPDNSVILCQHGNRRIARIESDGKISTLVDRYHGKRLNSPNDLVYAALCTSRIRPTGSRSRTKIRQRSYSSTPCIVSVNANWNQSLKTSQDPMASPSRRTIRRSTCRIPRRIVAFGCVMTSLLTAL